MFAVVNDTKRPPVSISSFLSYIFGKVNTFGQVTNFGGRVKTQMAAPGRKQHLTKLYWIAPSTTKKITPGKAWGLPHLFTPLTVLATKSANESTFIA